MSINLVNKKNGISKDSYISNYFKKGADLFYNYFSETILSADKNEFDILKLFDNWAEKRKLGSLEKRWIRIYVSDLLLGKNDFFSKKKRV